MAAQLGYCGLDRDRRPLRGDEIRPCWEARPDVPEAPAAGIPRSAPTPAALLEDRTNVRKLEFVEVATVARAGPAAAGGRGSEPDGFAARVAGEGTAPPPAPPETRWSLWGDVD
ncbi:MAG: hypothetical protein ACJ779_08320 [Chloroflexota bacterium]